MDWLKGGPETKVCFVTSGEAKLDTTLAQQMLNLRDGDHLCLFYDKDPAEQMPALIPFIHDALTKHEQFIYIADDQTVDELAGYLRRVASMSGNTSTVARSTCGLGGMASSGKVSSDKRAAQVLDFISAAAAPVLKVCGSRWK